jgi:hypothetical protein
VIGKEKEEEKVINGYGDYCDKFDVHGSIHLGNVCSIKVPTRHTFYMYSYSSLFLTLHVLGVIAPILRSTTAAFSHRCV